MQLSQHRRTANQGTDDRRTANLVGAWSLAAADAIRGATDRQLRGSGALAAALLTVALFPGERVDALRRVLGLTPSGVVRTIDRLVSAGWVERQAGIGDGREVLLQPTRRGARVASRALAARMKAIDSLLEPLTESEREEFLRLLEKLLPALPADRDEARHICRLCDHPACERSWCPVSAGAPSGPHRSRGAR
jgi:DNA-binding MarR family transcriptional regulator